MDEVLKCLRCCKVKNKIVKKIVLDVKINIQFILQFIVIDNNLSINPLKK